MYKIKAVVDKMILYWICVVISLELFASINAHLQVICGDSVEIHDVYNSEFLQQPR